MTQTSPWLTLRAVLEVVGGRLLAPARGEAAIAFSACAIDSRALEGGELFVPLPGARADGHQFIAGGGGGAAAGRLARAGPPGAASGSLARESHTVDPAWRATGKPVILVADPLSALQALGAHCRARAGLPVVAVTGSNGKTTTKEMIAAVLGTSRRVHKNRGNLNNHIGVPLTLSRLMPEHEALVIELGMSARGEIRALAALARPEVGVLTNAAAAHLEQLKTVEEIALAKSELAEALPREGLLVVNADDARLWSLNRSRPVTVRSYALENREADLLPSRVRMTGSGGAEFSLPDGTEVSLALLGRHNVLNALAALLVADRFGVPRDRAAAALASVRPERHRLERVVSRGVTILDDVYNANPASMREALVVLGALEGAGARRAVLADMLELGPDAEALHEQVGRCVPPEAWLYVAGAFAHATARGALAAGVPRGHVRLFEDVAEMAEAVRADARAGDLVLVKASRGMRLERVVDALNPSAASVDPISAAGRS